MAQLGRLRPKASALTDASVATRRAVAFFCPAGPPLQPGGVAQSIRIKLRGYEARVLEESCEMIREAATSSAARMSGPVRLPTRRKIFCVLRSPHVNKDSREHFEIRTHQRLIDLHNPSAQTIDSLMSLDLPAGVDIEVKL